VTEVIVFYIVICN